MQTVPCVSLKAHRPGEEALSHDFVGKEVDLWYKQLRRLQSAVHALRSAKSSPSALEWSSIVKASGFKSGFSVWWASREPKLLGAPLEFPVILPTYPVCLAIFEDFRLNFRKSEAWHVRCRMQVLAAKHKTVSDLMRIDLREPGPSQVDTLQIRTVHDALDFEASSRQVALKTSPDLRGHSEWRVDGVQVEPSRLDDQLFVVSGEAHVESRSELEQIQLLTSPSDIHADFISLWEPRWNKHS